jgi:hypothetical protein
MSVTSVDEEKVKNLIDTLLKSIQTEADPHVLNQYRSLIRKNVSFFQRSYLAAYLLMLREEPRGRQRKPGVDPARQRERPVMQASAPVALPEDEATQLFINIGRNRRVFPREILGLIYAKTSISKEDIGIITIMNNYSFLQVRNSVAAELMKTLNGFNFRGKTLTVNYARAQKEEDPEEPALKPPQEDAGAAYDDYDDPLEANDTGETPGE